MVDPLLLNPHLNTHTLSLAFNLIVQLLLLLLWCTIGIVSIQRMWTITSVCASEQFVYLDWVVQLACGDSTKTQKTTCYMHLRKITKPILSLFWFDHSVSLCDFVVVIVVAVAFVPNQFNNWFFIWTFPFTAHSSLQ